MCVLQITARKIIYIYVNCLFSKVDVMNVQYVMDICNAMTSQGSHVNRDSISNTQQHLQN